MPGSDLGQHRCRGPRLESGLPVGGGAFVSHRLAVEQEPASWGTSPTTRDQFARGQVGRVGRRARPPALPTDARRPASWASKVDLPDPLRPIRATTSPGRQRRGDTPLNATIGPYSTPEPIDPGHGIGVPAEGTVRIRRRCPGQPLAERSGLAAGISDGKGHRCPAGQSGQLHQRRGHRRDGHDLGGRSRRRAARRSPGTSITRSAKGITRSQAMFGQHHRHANVVNQAGQGGQHLFGGGGVECRRGLVEHQDPGRGT